MGIVSAQDNINWSNGDITGKTKENNDSNERMLQTEGEGSTASSSVGGWGGFNPWTHSKDKIKFEDSSRKSFSARQKNSASKSLNVNYSQEPNGKVTSGWKSNEVDTLDVPGIIPVSEVVSNSIGGPSKTSLNLKYSEGHLHRGSRSGSYRQKTSLVIKPGKGKGGSKGGSKGGGKGGGKGGSKGSKYGSYHLRK